MGTYLLITPREDELYHFGIKGMKWGIRRFQPYQKGEKVKGGKEVGAATKVKQRPSSGNIIERYKAKKLTKKRVEAAKKAREKRKTDANLEAEKKKAIESGTIEDLAKFKGKLTNEEYQRAFTRLQNEKKVAEMVAANQKTVWDKIDKGMAIVQKVGGYANTIATAKENFNKFDDAFNKKDNEAKKESDKAAKEAAKNAFMNSASYEELVKNGSKYNLDTKDYNMVLSRLSLDKKTKAELGIDKAEAEKKEKETPKDGSYESTDYTGKKTNVRKNASYDNSDPKDFEAPKHAYEKTPKTTREKAGYVNPDGERGYSRPEPKPEDRTLYKAKKTGKKTKRSSYYIRTIAGHK